VLDGLDLAVDVLGRLPHAVEREQELERDAEEPLVLLEAGLDERPVPRTERREGAAVQLVDGELLVRVSRTGLLEPVARLIVPWA
jgi:hypothetical protein